MEEGHLDQRVQSTLLCREDNFLVRSGNELYSFERQLAGSFQAEGGWWAEAGRAEAACCSGQSQYLSTARAKGTQGERQGMR